MQACADAKALFLHCDGQNVYQTMQACAVARRSCSRCTDDLCLMQAVSEAKVTVEKVK